jgi:hypothetical protein
MAGRRVLVRAILMSQAVYHIISIDIPVKVLASVGCDKVPGGKCKVN